VTQPTPAGQPPNRATGDEPEIAQPAPPRVPGERRLAHPPSDRYREAEPVPAVEDPAATAGRGVALGVGVAVVGAAAITFLGGVLAVSSGLVVAAGATGWAVAAGVRVGAGARLASGPRVRLAVGLALAAVALGQLALWVYARSEGGVLGPLDYLAEVFGLLVPLELLVAWIVAWATAR
jgi:hypothetical protein